MKDEALDLLKEANAEVTVGHRIFPYGVKGTTMVLWDRVFGDLSNPNVKIRERPIDRERRVWRDKLHFSDVYGLHFPSENIMEMIIGGAQYAQLKVKTQHLATLLKVSLYAEPLLIRDRNKKQIMSIEHPDILPFEKNVRTKLGLVPVIRPRLDPPWYGTGILHLMDDRISAELLKAAIVAGGANGIGTWRKFYGKFQLLGFKEA